MKNIRKYSIYSLLLGCFLFAQLHAQTAPRIWVGVHGGAEFANFVLDPAQHGFTISSRTGFEAGAEIDDWISDNFAFCMQMLYVQKGFAEKDNFSDNSSSSISYLLPYIEVPIFLKATIGSGPFKPFILIGPEIGVRLTAKAIASSPTNGSDTTVILPDSLFTKTNFGILIGAGVSFQYSPTIILFMDAAYDYGVSNLNPFFGKTQFGTTDTQKGFTRDFRISIGILIAIVESGE